MESPNFLHINWVQAQWREMARSRRRPNPGPTEPPEWFWVTSHNRQNVIGSSSCTILSGSMVATRKPLFPSGCRTCEPAHCHLQSSLDAIWRCLLLQISAQESRRKKKEYMDQLERKVEILLSENSDYRKRVENLESKNASLLSQVASLQAIVARGRKWRHHTHTEWRHTSLSWTLLYSPSRISSRRVHATDTSTSPDILVCCQHN